MLAMRSTGKSHREYSLAAARLALLPVACGAIFFASGLTPNRTGGGGPVCCGTSGCIPKPVGCGCCCGAGWPKPPAKPVGWAICGAGIAVRWGSRGAGKNELTPNP